MKKDDQPVTHGQLKVELKTVRKELRDEMKILRQEIRELVDNLHHHFDVVAENIHREVAGANRDEISLIQDKMADHEERLVVLEKT